jgi:hypothetical protein
MSWLSLDETDHVCTYDLNWTEFFNLCSWSGVSFYSQLRHNYTIMSRAQCPKNSFVERWLNLESSMSSSVISLFKCYIFCFFIYIFYYWITHDIPHMLQSACYTKYGPMAQHTFHSPDGAICRESELRCSSRRLQLLKKHYSSRKVYSNVNHKTRAILFYHRLGT